MDPSTLLLSREIARERVQTEYRVCSWYEAEIQLYSVTAQKTMTSCWRKIRSVFCSGWLFTAHRYSWR